MPDERHREFHTLNDGIQRLSRQLTRKATIGIAVTIVFGIAGILIGLASLGIL